MHFFRGWLLKCLFASEICEWVNENRKLFHILFYILLIHLVFDFSPYNYVRARFAILYTAKLLENFQDINISWCMISKEK